MAKAFLTVLLATLAAAPIPAAAQAGVFERGVTDRATFEMWFAGLGVEGKEGAAFWADQRSKPAPLSCDQPNKSEFWLQGCNEAQKRLVGSDAQRKADPLYRRGWNSYQVTGTAPDSTPEATIPRVSAAPPRAERPVAAIPPPPQPAKPWVPDPSDPRVGTAAQDCDAYRVFNAPAYRPAPPIYRDSLQRCQQDKNAARTSLDADRRRYDEEQTRRIQAQREARQVAMEKAPDNVCRDPAIARLIIRNMTDALRGRGDEVLDIEHLVTVSQDKADPEVFTCHGVFLLTRPPHVPLTVSSRRNVAGDLIWTWRVE